MGILYLEVRMDILLEFWSKANIVFYTNLSLWSSPCGGTQELAGATLQMTAQTISDNQ